MTAQTIERPILFSTAMVRAILSGRKTQTRRVMKLQPHFLLEWHGHKRGKCWMAEWLSLPPGVTSSTFSLTPAYVIDTSGVRGDHQPDSAYHTQSVDIKQKLVGCRHGQPGDFLWVRETWRATPNGIEYLADQDKNYGGWKPSIHMPRAHSRLTLRITEVRAQRLRDINELDCEAELGVEPYSLGDRAYAEFRALWDSINAGRGQGWERNPWVWAITFDRVKP